MSEETTATAAETAEMTDDQVGQFFESGGEEPESQISEPQEKKQEEEPQQKEERKVNYGALHEERQRRKELQSKVEAMEGRFNQILQNLQPKEQIPAIEEDPVRNFDTRIGSVEQMLRQQLENNQRQHQEAAVINSYRQSAAVFAQENPDFNDAYSHFINSRRQELQAMGYAPNEAQNILQQEEFAAAIRAMQNETNPAAMIYEAAKVRGYKKAEPQNSDKMKTIEKGVQASRVSGGSPIAGNVTLESLAEMSDEEFSKNWDKLIGNSNRY